MGLKKIVIFLLILIVTMGCENNGIDHSHKSISNVTSSEYEFVPTNIDDLVEHADNITKGKVVSIEDIGSEDGTKLYTFKVTQDFKGSLESKLINVYESEGALTQDTMYLLFLESFENSSYPDTIYTSIYKDLGGILDLSEKNFSNSYKIFKNKSYNNIIKEIKNSKKIKVKKEKYKIEKQANSVASLVDSSEVIIKIVPIEFFSKNKYVKLSRVNIINSIKSNNDFNQSQLILPASAKIGETYYVFLKKYDDHYDLSTRKGSFINTNSQDAKELEKLYDLN